MDLWCLADGQLMGRRGMLGGKRKERGLDGGKEKEDVDVAIKSEGDHECSKNKKTKKKMSSVTFFFFVG